jgi:hypothetical protein
MEYLASKVVAGNGGLQAGLDGRQMAGRLGLAVTAA